jgi:hypothetical protein
MAGNQNARRMNAVGILPSKNSFEPNERRCGYLQSLPYTSWKKSGGGAGSSGL